MNNENFKLLDLFLFNNNDEKKLKCDGTKVYLVGIKEIKHIIKK